MPYNTRRKSLSLSELGITVPKRARVTVQPSPPNTAVDGEEPPIKKSKRSHNSTSPTVGDMSPPRATAIRFKDEKPKQPAALSPPPSPAREGDSKVDIEGIRDEIVVGAIQQLEKTGNRPHLVKELSAILATNIPAVERYACAKSSLHPEKRTNILPRSANPSALISARLTAYLNRSWPAISPCPLAKDLSPSHPRRLFFYLTTMPPQPMPEHVDPIPKHNRIISPSLSSASAADEEDERYNRARAAMSPSPEVDLSSPELDDENCDPVGSFSSRNSMSREHPPTTTNLAHNRRAASPQLEREERDFKQTANLLHEQARLRRASEEDVKMADTAAGAELDSGSVAQSVENDSNEEEEDTEAAAELFQHAEHLRPYVRVAMEFSSPVLQARSLDDNTTGGANEAESGGSPLKHERKDECMEGMMTLDLDDVSDERAAAVDTFAWESLQSPENIELSELDDMFDAFP